jgi:outer membrane protein assembly factor BamE (lipoprotein component of BamABCDE complex)
MRVAVARALLALMAAGCAAVERPPRIDDATRARIEVGTTTREEVLLTLGLPEATGRQGQSFFYQWERSVAIAILPAMYAVAAFGHADIEHLRIEFDDSGVVSDIAEGAYRVTIPFELSKAAAYMLATSEEDAEAKLFRTKRGACVVYLYVERSGSNAFSSIAAAYLQIDDRYAGDVGADGWFYRLVLLPGEHVVTVVDWKRPDIPRFDQPFLVVDEEATPEVKDTLTFVCNVGEATFIEIGYPAFARFPRLRSTAAVEAREAIANGQLVIGPL